MVKNFIISLLFCLIFYGSILPQTLKDSLLELVPKRQGEERILILFELIELISTDSNETKKYINEAEKLSNDLNFNFGKSKILFLKGLNAFNRNRMEEAREFFNTSLLLSRGDEEYLDLRGDLFSKIGDIFNRLNQNDSAFYFHSRALELREITGDKRKISISLNDIGLIHWRKGNFNEAIGFFNKSLKLREEIGNELGMAISYNNLGTLFWRLGDYQKAVEYYFNSLTIRKKLSDNIGISRVLNNIGMVYSDLEKFEDALQFFRDGLAVAVKYDYKSVIGYSYSNLAEINKKINNLDSAFFYYNLSYESYSRENDLNGQVTVLLNIGSLYEVKKEIQKAFEYYLRGLELAEKIKDNFRVASAEKYLANIYFLQGKISTAKAYSLKSLKFAIKENIRELIKDNYLLLSKISENENDYRMAYKYHHLYSAFKDSLFLTESESKIQGLKYLFENEKKETEIAKLTEENRLKSRERTSLMIILVIFFILLIVSIAAFILKLKSNKKLTEQGTIILKQKDEIEKTVESLKYSEDRSRMYFELSIVGMAIVGRDKKFIMVNDKFCNILGYSKEDLTKMNWAELTPTEEFNTEKRNYEKKENKEEYFFTKNYIRKDGTKITCDVSVKYIPPYNNAGDYYIAIINDITEKKIAQDQLAMSEFKYRTIFTNLPLGILSYNSEGVIIECNDEFIKIIGSSREMLIGLNMLKNLKDPNIIKAINKSLNGETGYSEGIYKSITSNKSTIGRAWFYPMPLENSGFSGVGIIEDITKQREMQDELVNTHTIYREVIEGIKGIPYKYNYNTDNYDFIGGGIDDFFGESYPNFQIENLKKLQKKINFINQSNINNFENYKNKFKDGKLTQYKVEYEIILPDGKVKWVSDSAIPVKDKETGKVVASMGILQDITERKEIENQLIEAKELAEKSDKLKSEFLAQVSHEIRTPINSILSFSTLIQDEISNKIDDDLKTSFNIIQRAGKRIIRTIDLILNMSELQIGSYECIPREIDLYEKVLKKIIEEFSPQVKEKMLTLELIKKTDKTIIIADEYTVNQIFSHLIDNAIKYTSKGGVVISIYENGGERLNVDVKDTGIGISKDFIPDLFKPFSQEEQGYTRKYEGNGLGLAIIKKYTEMNSAEIFVESEKGKGSIFRVSLPILS